VNRLLSLDPLYIRSQQSDIGLEVAIRSVPQALKGMGFHYTADALVESLSGYGVEVSAETLYRWKRETEPRR